MTETVPFDELSVAIGQAVDGVSARWGRAYYLDKAAKHEAPVEMYAAMAEQGLFAIGVPEALGGSGGGITATALVMEAMSRAGIPPMLYSLTAFSRQAVVRFGTEDQIRRWVVPTLTADITFCFAFTEPDAGTNSFRMRSSAERQPDGRYLLRGQKVYISGADQADKMLVAVRTTPLDEVTRKSDGISLFVIDTTAPGVTLVPMNIEWHAPERQFTVFLDDVAVDADALIGEEGQGASAMFESLNAERVVISAWTLGLGDFALAKAVDYARVRSPWGQPIGAHQAVAHPLARAKARLEAARAMTYRAAARVDSGQPAGDDANIAKLLASEAADAAIDAAIQTHGGSGFDADTDVITLWPMIRILRVAPLNNEMVLNYIAEHILRLPRSY